MTTENDTYSVEASDSIDSTVAYNMVRSAAKEIAAHEARAKEVIRNLNKVAGDSETTSQLDERKTRSIADNFNIAIKDVPTSKLAREIATILLDDITRTESASYKTLDVVAPPERKATWTAENLLPVTSAQDIAAISDQTEDIPQSDWQEGMNQLLRLGGTFLTNSIAVNSVATDCLYGPQRRLTTSVHFENLSKDTINIAIQAHTPELVKEIVTASRSEAFATMIAEAGAKSIQLFEVCGSDDALLGDLEEVQQLSTPNGLGLVLTTGALDMFLANTQNVQPKVMAVAECYKTTVLTTNKAQHMSYAEPIELFCDTDLTELAELIVSRVIESYKGRCDITRQVLSEKLTTQIGFNLETIDKHYGCLDRIASALINGTIKGIVSLSGCIDSEEGADEKLSDLVDILLKDNILVFANGCAASSLATQGFCSPTAHAKCGDMLQMFLDVNLPPVWHFGDCVDTAQILATLREVAKYAGHPMKKLPFAAVVPESSTHKNDGATLAFRMSGLDCYHSTCAIPEGAANVKAFLNEGVKEQLGSAMHVESDYKKIGEMIVSHFSNARSELCWR